jgi:drug/metabolite transporter (DMT)-like permease
MLLVQCLTAPFGALIEWVWLGTFLGRGQVVCGLVILFGVGVALSPGKHLKLSRRQLWTGVAFSVVSAFGGAGGAVLSRKAYFVVRATGEHIDPINAGFQRVIGGALIAAIFLLLVRWRSHRLLPKSSLASSPKLTKDKWRVLWPWVLGNSLAGQTLGVSAMQRALETTPAWVVLSIIATTPVVVIPFAFVFEGERPNARSLMGGVVAVVGVIGLAWLKH